MRKEVIIGLTTVLLVATPVFAAPNTDHGKPAEPRDNHGQEVAAEKTVDVPPTVIPTTVPVTVPPLFHAAVETPEVEAEDVDTTETPTPTPDKHEKGKGPKVLDVSVSPTQCDPKADWKNHGAYVSCVAKTHPGGEVVSEAARSEIGKKHEPFATPSASPTPPITSPETTLGFHFSPLDNLVKALGHIIQSLPFFHHS